MKPRWVLVVEDDDDIRDVELSILEYAGYPAVGVGDGLSALEVLRRRGPPALILLDIMLPQMNGIELVRAVRASPELAHVPVVVVSGDGSALEVARALRADGVIVKPPELDVLLETVRRVIERSSASPPASHPE